MKYMAPVSLMVVALLVFAMTGCGTESTETTGSSTPAADAGDDHSDHDHGDQAQHDESGQTDMEKMKVALAKLSPEDAASAERQHTCPVSGEMLGTMGAPQKVDVNGQDVWVCCAGCKDDLLASPDEYLANLNKE